MSTMVFALLTSVTHTARHRCVMSCGVQAGVVALMRRVTSGMWVRAEKARPGMGLAHRVQPSREHHPQTRVIRA
jgi:hypothetical protein